MKYINTYKYLYKMLISILFSLTFLISFSATCIYIGANKIEPLITQLNLIASDYLDDFQNVKVFNLTEDTKIYDNQNNLIGTLSKNNVINLSYEEIPSYIINGYIAVEDRNFLTHNGLDFKAIIRAFIDIVKNKSITQGGSTITQQVIKNNILYNISNRFQRKILEFFIAPKLERQMSKEDIITSYCNTNYYGNNVYGIGSASKYYFDKTPLELTLSECAILVGISNSPSRYNPKTDAETTLEKRNRVLEDMFETNTITYEEYQQALNEIPTYTFTKDISEIEDYATSFAIHQATLILMEQSGFNFQYTFDTEVEYNTYQDLYEETYSRISKNIRSGGYVIYTSLDSQKQEMLQQELDTVLSSNTSTSNNRYDFQGSLTLINNETNMIEAIIGGRSGDEYNRAYQSARQPGSTIKPLAVYMPAYETGNYYPSKILNDNLSNIKGEPENADKKYRGNMTIREAIARSVNTIPFKIGLEIGNEKILSYLSKMRFSHLSYQDTGNNSLTIGGFTYGTNTYEMATAYNMIVNGGQYLQNNFITKIEDQSANVIYTNPYEYEQIFSKDIAYMMLDTLREPFEMSVGTAKNYKVPNLNQAGKTGTTNNNYDSWLIGMSPYYTLAIWVGYDYPKEIKSPSSYTGKLYKNIFTKLHTDLDTSIDFTKPDTVITLPINSKGDPTSTTPIDNTTTASNTRSDIFSGTILNNLQEKQTEQKLKTEGQQFSEVLQRIRLLESYYISSYESWELFQKEYDNIKSTLDSLEIYPDKYPESYSLALYDLSNAYNKILETAKPFIEQYEKELQTQKENEACDLLIEYLSSYENFVAHQTEISSILNTYKNNTTIQSYKNVFDNYTYIYNTYDLPYQQSLINQAQSQQQNQNEETSSTGTDTDEISLGEVITSEDTTSSSNLASSYDTLNETPRDNTSKFEDTAQDNEQDITQDSDRVNEPQNVDISIDTEENMTTEVEQ